MAKFKVVLMPFCLCKHLYLRGSFKTNQKTNKQIKGEKKAALIVFVNKFKNVRYQKKKNSQI